MTHEAPRESALFALRESRLGARHYQSVKLSYPFGPGQAAAYSQDSDIVGCGFAQPSPNLEGPIFSRRIGDTQDGKQMTSLRVNGGAAWCPENNKFYSGASPASGDIMAVIIDPLTDIPEAISGFSTGFSVNGGRAFWNPATSDIWLRFGNAGNGFARINVSDNSISYVACASPSDFTYCASNTSIYFATAGAIYRVTSGGAVSTVFTQTDFETALGSSVSNWLIGAVEYVDSLDRVVFSIRFTWNPGGGLNTFQQLWKIDPSTDMATFATIAGAASEPWATIMYYSPQFDRLIVWQNGATVSYDPVDFSIQTAILTGDTLTARGCFADTPNKVGLPVLRSGVYSVQFYEAADL